jgi:uncharacterized Zn finger protein
MNISYEEVRRLAAEPYFSRGKEYFDDRLVDLLSVSSDSVKACVAGTQVYTVTLKRKDRIIEAICTCPAFDDFGPCKHLVAVGLAVLEHHRNGYKPSHEFLERMRERQKIEKFLKSKNKKELIELIWELNNQLPEVLYELEQMVEEEDDEEGY